MSKVDDIPASIALLRKTQASKKTRSFQWRKRQVAQISKMISENEKEFEDAFKKDLGHQQPFFSHNVEFSFIYQECNNFLENLETWLADEPRSTPLAQLPGKSFIVKEPLGVILMISPWNYPLSLAIVPLIGAVACGNCVLLKPSEVSPATSGVIAQLAPKYLDSEAIIVVEGGVEEATFLLKQKWDHIFYTGNGAVGKVILRAAAEHLTPCTLELGGKCPVLVDKTADLDVTARRIVWGKTLNCGQTCVAPDYVLVDKSIELQLEAKIKQVVQEWYGDTPQTNSNYSRIINERHANRIATIMERAKKEEGIEVITGGQSDTKDRYIAPTFFRNVSKTSALMEDEIFGPLLPIFTFNTLQEGFDFINSRDKPLASYLFSSNSKNIKEFLDTVSSGGAVINDIAMNVLNLDLPFGGVGPSGMGFYHGISSVETFSHRKAVSHRSTMMDLDLRYPPFSLIKSSRMQFVQQLNGKKLAWYFMLGASVIVAVALAYGANKVDWKSINLKSFFP